jgi:hypothetical protein
LITCAWTDTINVAKTAKERKKLYRKCLETAGKLLVWSGKKGGRLCGLPETARLDRLWNRLVSDLTDACHIHVWCGERVLEGKRLKGTHRILSTADRAASWIAKGERGPTVGYKPQIARSANGLVTAMLVPEDNAAASTPRSENADHRFSSIYHHLDTGNEPPAWLLNPETRVVPRRRSDRPASVTECLL